MNHEGNAEEENKGPCSRDLKQGGKIRFFKKTSPVIFLLFVFFWYFYIIA
jgi:hypothetical protein